LRNGVDEGESEELGGCVVFVELIFELHLWGLGEVFIRDDSVFVVGVCGGADSGEEHERGDGGEVHVGRSLWTSPHVGALERRWQRSSCWS